MVPGQCPLPLGSHLPAASASSAKQSRAGCIRNQTLFGVRYFYAVHHRQGDFVGACAQWQDAHTIDGLRCLISADDALRMLRDIFQVPT